MTERKSSGYWKNWNNVKRALEIVIQQFGYFPPGKIIRQARGEALYHAISRYHGGLSTVRKRLGSPPYSPHHRKHFGYWNEWDNVKQELETIIASTGRFPTNNELTAIGKGSLSVAVLHHGGFPAVRARLGYKHPPSPDDPLKNWDNVQQELETIIQKLGRFPTSRDLNHLEKGDLRRAITTYHDGLSNARARMSGQPPRKFKKGTTHHDDVEKELREITQNLGRFPSRKDLYRQGKSGLLTAIDCRFGGMTAVRQHMGYELQTKPPGYWDNWHNVERETNDTIQQLGYFPSLKDLAKLGKKAFLTAITKKHGGLTLVRQRLGHGPIRKQQRYWHNEENIESELRTLIAHLGHFPTHQEIYQHKRASLAYAIALHGGVAKFKKRFGFETKTKPNHYWQSWDNCEEELRTIIERLQKFPTHNDLRELGLHSVSAAIINYHGGMKTVKSRMGYTDQPPKRPKEQLEAILDEYLKE